MPSQPAVAQPAVATLRSRYAEQAASDLEANRRRQQELLEKVEALKQEETLLLDILTLADRFGDSPHAATLPRQAAGAPSAPAEEEPPLLPPAAPAASASVASTTSKTAANPKSTPASKSTPSSKSATKAKSAAKGGPSRQPLLGDLFLELLDGHDEPRLAKELNDELRQKHPDRAPTPQVVRNTLESLVAKGRIQRQKQKRSVMYSAK